MPIFEQGEPTLDAVDSLVDAAVRGHFADEDPFVRQAVASSAFVLLHGFLHATKGPTLLLERLATGDAAEEDLRRLLPSRPYQFFRNEVRRDPQLGLAEQLTYTSPQCTEILVYSVIQALAERREGPGPLHSAYAAHVRRERVTPLHEVWRRRPLVNDFAVDADAWPDLAPADFLARYLDEVGEG